LDRDNSKSSFATNVRKRQADVSTNSNRTQEMPIKVTNPDMVDVSSKNTLMKAVMSGEESAKQQLLSQSGAEFQQLVMPDDLHEHSHEEDMLAGD